MDKPLRILIVDDNAQDRARARDELTKDLVIQVQEASNKETVDKALESGAFDVVITDSDHSWISGLDLLKKFKARHPACPVIMFTDRGYDEIAIEAMINGLDGYIVKSARPGRLTHAVRAALQKIREAEERKQAEEALKESEEKFRAIFDSVHDVIMLEDRTGNLIDINRRAEQLTGYSKSELIGANKFEKLVVPEDRARLRDVIRDVFEGRDREFEVRWRTKTGEILYLEGLCVPKRSAPGEVLSSMICTLRDITGRKQADEKIRVNEQKLRVVLSAMDIALFSQDRDLRYNWIYQAQLGYTAEQVIGKTDEELLPPDGEEVMRIKRRVIESNKGTRAEVRLVVNNQEAFYDLILEPWHNASGEVIGIIGASLNITERKRAEETIKYQAYHDLLTGLPNMELFLIYLDLALTQARRNGYKIGIVFLDVDRFKNVNDSLGRSVGDKLIKEVASRILAGIRKSDKLARIGGDAFGLLLSDLQRAEDIIDGLQKIKRAMQAPFRINSHELYITVSFGISTFPEDGQDAETLLKNADNAMFHAKESGRDSYHFFNPSLNKRTVEKLILENSLRKTIERNELVVYYQPQVDVANGEIVGMEALVRWKHPEMGVLKPEQFIPLAEEIGFIAKIDEWVLRAACEQNKAWQNAGLKAVPVSVNMSSNEFLDLYLPGNVSRVLEQTRLDPKYLEIEITESTAMRNVELALINLVTLRKRGVRLAIDDFGTGFSSLSYLKRFPLHQLKIDKSFIKGVAYEAGDQAIVHAVIVMGRSLNLQVVAEGVENDEQFAFLKKERCQLIQGFIYTEPLPAGRFEKLLRQEKLAA